MSSNPLILAIETATLAGSVCVAEGSRVLAARAGDARVSHSNGLLRDISDILEETKLVISDVEIFAAAVGPGSFTGLRIGLATVKALAATTGRLCVGVPTLNAVAQAGGASRATVSLLPAGRGELFVQMFSVSAEGMVKALDDPAHLSPPKTLARYALIPEVIWAGDGAQLHREMIEEYSLSHQDRTWTIAAPTELLASNVATLGFMQQEFAVGPELLQAVYIRPSDAELKTNVVNN